MTLNQGGTASEGEIIRALHNSRPRGCPSHRGKRGDLPDSRIGSAVVNANSKRKIAWPVTVNEHLILGVFVLAQILALRVLHSS